MSEPTAKPQPGPESQKQRWVKYGANVLLVTSVVVVLAIVATALAQRTNRRLDTTAAGLYSLKPQTVNIIRDNKQKIKLVSLYTRNANPSGRKTEEVDYAQVVDDLLDEYARKGKNIDVESIDPIANPSKVDDLVKEVINKYGGEIVAYKNVAAAYPESYKKIRELSEQLIPKVAALPDDALRESSEDIGAALRTVQTFPDALSRSERDVKARLAQNVPDYRGAIQDRATSVKNTAQTISEQADAIVKIFDKAKADPKTRPDVKQYIEQSTPIYQQIKQAADDLAKKTDIKGELKLDDLRQKLREQNAILVMGEKDMRSLSADQVWKRNDEELRRLRPGDEVQAKAKFSGEQQITSAILSLTQEKKPKVVFVRPGGGPLTSPGFPPFQPSGPFSKVADRLREYNFEVLEKDLSGTWEMQARMRQQPAEPEPSDEEIKDAVWVVLSIPAGNSPMGPTPPIAPKVAEHLKQGGSALMLFYPQADDLHEALADWGISVDTHAIAVHEANPSQGGPSGDMIEDAQRVPFIFVSNSYGDHPITRPLQSLDMLLLRMLPVSVTETKGVKATKLLPLPQGAWGERDTEAASQGQPVTFEAAGKDGAAGDIPGPIFVGAAGEKDGGGRVVVIGGLELALNDIVTLPDSKLLQRERPILVARFPGNGELLANSVFWLARLEPLIAISPAAMEVSRIQPMSDGTLKAWRIGALLVGLPGIVIAAGAFVYFARRD
jgi:ABC-type uncharacterized transport system involved in gliding motility auxiliary subunit